MTNRKFLSMFLVAAGLLVLGYAPAAQAQSNCSDAASCGASFDDANPGDNQGGDAGADREPPSDRQK